MKRIIGAVGAALLLVVCAADVSAQAWRGMGRLHGIVVDPQGKPIEGAKVMLFAHRGSNTGPDPILTDKNGRWTAGGLIGGGWNIDVEATGFEKRQLSASVSELERLVPAMRIELQPKPEEKPAEEEKEAIVVGGVEISPEIAESIEAANNFMKTEQWKEAAAEYEKAIAALPDNQQLQFALSRAYYGAGELKKAIAQLQHVHQTDTGNVMAASLLADMLLQDEQIDEANKILAALPPGSVSDPNTVINLGIRFINNGKPEEAFKYFEQAVGLAPELGAAYYYRGIASLQMKKMKEAKSDLQKVVALAPDSQEAADAKDLLAQLK